MPERQPAQKERETGMSEWRWELKHPEHLKEGEWETGFESYDDAYEAMSERLTELIDEIAELHPELTDEEIEEQFEWDVREE